MAWRISWHLECDHCHKLASFSGQPSSAVERKANKYGWEFIIDCVGLIRHLCRKCAKQSDVRFLYERKSTEAKTCEAKR